MSSEGTTRAAEATGGVWRRYFATLTLSLLAFSLLTPVVASLLTAASTGVALVAWSVAGGL